MSLRDEPYSYAHTVSCVRETDRALLIHPDEGGDFWVPKSVVHDDSEVYEEGHEGVLVVQQWFAEKEGWE
jgi:hypothetical protein